MAHLSSNSAVGSAALRAEWCGMGWLAWDGWALGLKGGVAASVDGVGCSRSALVFKLSPVSGAGDAELRAEWEWVTGGVD